MISVINDGTARDSIQSLAVEFSNANCADVILEHLLIAQFAKKIKAGKLISLRCFAAIWLNFSLGAAHREAEFRRLSEFAGRASRLCLEFGISDIDLTIDMLRQAIQMKMGWTDADDQRLCSGAIWAELMQRRPA